MDWMERAALIALTEHEALPLKRLLPKDVPSNLFSYHLSKLLHEGLVERNQGRYRLTAKGKQLAGQINVDTGRPRLQPRIVVMFYITNAAGQVVLFRWQRQPNYGYVSLPYGKIDYGKSLAENVHDELLKKTALEVEPKHKTDFYLTIKEKSAVISHLLVHLYTATTEQIPVSSVRTGECFWGKLNDQSLLYLPGVHDIVELAKNSKRQALVELKYELGASLRRSSNLFYLKNLVCPKLLPRAQVKVRCQAHQPRRLRQQSCRAPRQKSRPLIVLNFPRRIFF